MYAPVICNHGSPPTGKGRIVAFQFGSVSASGTGQIRLESPGPAMPDLEPILTGMARCLALHFSYQFPGCK